MKGNSGLKILGGRLGASPRKAALDSLLSAQAVSWIILRSIDERLVYVQAAYWNILAYY